MRLHFVTKRIRKKAGESWGDKTREKLRCGCNNMKMSFFLVEEDKSEISCRYDMRIQFWQRIFFRGRSSERSIGGCYIPLCIMWRYAYLVRFWNVRTHSIIDLGTRFPIASFFSSVMWRKDHKRVSREKKRTNSKKWCCVLRIDILDLQEPGNSFRKRGAWTCS